MDGSKSAAGLFSELINDDAATDPGRAAILSHAFDGDSLVSGLNPVVDQDDSVARPQGWPLEPQRVAKAPVVRGCQACDLVSREKAVTFPDRDKPDTELNGCSGAQKEPPGLDPARLR